MVYDTESLESEPPLESDKSDIKKGISLGRTETICVICGSRNATS